MSGETTGALDALQEKMGYRFGDKGLLTLALTHASASEGRKGFVSNERLEFLGDAVLQLSVTEALYRRHPDWNEGEMTQSRAHLVCEASLAEQARLLAIGDALVMGRGERQTQGAQRASALADAFEAVLGALFLDAGFEAAKAWVLRRFDAPLRVTEGEAPQDKKTTLQDFLQKRWGIQPVYQLEGEEGPVHERVFTVAVQVKGEVWGRGTGRSKKEAEQQAAGDALAKADARADGV